MIPSLPQLIAASLTTLPDQAQDMARHDLTREFHLLMQPPPQIDADPAVIATTETDEEDQPPLIGLPPPPASLQLDPEAAFPWHLGRGGAIDRVMPSTMPDGPIMRAASEDTADVAPLPRIGRQPMGLRTIHLQPPIPDEVPGPDALAGTDMRATAQERPGIPIHQLTRWPFRPASADSMPDMISHDDMLMPVDTERQDGQHPLHRPGPTDMPKGQDLQRQPLPRAMLPLPAAAQVLPAPDPGSADLSPSTIPAAHASDRPACIPTAATPVPPPSDTGRAPVGTEIRNALPADSPPIACRPLTALPAPQDTIALPAPPDMAPDRAGTASEPMQDAPSDRTVWQAPRTASRVTTGSPAAKPLAAGTTIIDRRFSPSIAFAAAIPVTALTTTHVDQGPTEAPVPAADALPATPLMRPVAPMPMDAMQTASTHVATQPFVPHDPDTAPDPETPSLSLATPNVPRVLPEPPAAIATPPHGTAGQPPPVHRQIGLQMARQDDGPTILQLEPAELGLIRMEMRARNGQLMLHIHADRPETLELLRRHAPELQAEMAQHYQQGTQMRFSSGQDRRSGRPAPRDDEAGAGFLATRGLTGRTTRSHVPSPGGPGTLDVKV